VPPVTCVDMIAPPSPDRKAKQNLTLIPETERSIDYRFEFTIVGEGAKVFAEGAVHSEMAEAFRPTAKHEEEKRIQSPEPHHDGKEHEGIEVQDHEVHLLGQGATCSSKGALADAVTEKNKLILFSPIGEGTKALARVRFTCIEQFCDSLPLSRDTAVAMNQAVVFLFHPRAVSSGSPRKIGSGTPIEEFKSDFISRFAEINHTPKKFRPHVRILCFAVEPEVEDQLTELGKTKDVTLYSQPDDGEDTVMESLQGICETLISEIARRTDEAQKESEAPTTALLATESVPASKSSCCSLL